MNRLHFHRIKFYDKLTIEIFANHIQQVCCTIRFTDEKMSILDEIFSLRRLLWLRCLTTAIVEPTDTTKDFPSAEFAFLLSRGKSLNPTTEMF